MRGVHAIQEWDLSGRTRSIGEKRKKVRGGERSSERQDGRWTESSSERDDGSGRGERLSIILATVKRKEGRSISVNIREDRSPDFATENVPSSAQTRLRAPSATRRPSSLALHMHKHTLVSLQHLTGTHIHPRRGRSKTDCSGTPRSLSS